MNDKGFSFVKNQADTDTDKIRIQHWKRFHSDDGPQLLSSPAAPEPLIQTIEKSIDIRQALTD